MKCVIFLLLLVVMVSAFGLKDGSTQNEKNAGASSIELEDRSICKVGCGILKKNKKDACKLKCDCLKHCRKMNQGKKLEKICKEECHKYDWEKLVKKA